MMNHYKNTIEPVHLEQSYQDEWVKMVAAQFAQSGDQENAARQLGQVQNPTAIIDRLQQESHGIAGIF